MSDADGAYYERLGVDPSASQVEIRRAYRQLARETHPDRNPNDPQAEARFRRVKAAYDVLGDPAKRARYDRQLRAQTGGAPAAVTASSIGETGCVTYYLPRVGIGLLATIAFFVLDAFEVWRADDPQMLWTAVAGVSVVVGGVAVLIFRLFPDTSDDYAVRFSTDDVRVWNEQQMVLRLPWTAVAAIQFDGDTETLVLQVRPRAAAGLSASPPAIPRVDRTGDVVRVAINLAQTDVRRPALHRILRHVQAA